MRAYLQSQAAKLSIPELVEKVRSDSLQVQAAAVGVPPGRFLERPADGEWCANEVMAHVVNGAHRVGSAIIAVLDQGVTPKPIEDWISREVPARSAAEWWADLVTTRDALFARLTKVIGSEHLEVRWQHPFFGELNWREWLLFLRVHDLDHARQMQAITASLNS